MTGSGVIDFTAAVLKGLVEHQDAGAYFGSSSAMKFWKTSALQAGWVDAQGRVTPRGLRHYKQSGLADLAKDRTRRAYDWDWSCYVKESG